MICDITLDDGRSESYKFWPLNDFMTNDIDPESRKSLEMVERFFVQTSSDELYIVQHFLLVDCTIFIVRYESTSPYHRWSCRHIEFDGV